METSKEDAEILRAGTYLSKLNWRRHKADDALADQATRRALIAVFVVFCLLAWATLAYALI